MRSLSFSLSFIPSQLSLRRKDAAREDKLSCPFSQLLSTGGEEEFSPKESERMVVDGLLLREEETA